MIMDKLDVINRKNSIHSNLIKWWDINMLPSENDENFDDLNSEDLETGIDEFGNSTNLDTDSNGDAFLYEEDYINEYNNLDNNSKDLVENILVQNDKSDVFEKTNAHLEEQNKAEADAAAMEIYERLMREAAEDEAKKQNEIEMAKLQAAQT